MEAKEAEEPGLLLEDIEETIRRIDSLIKIHNGLTGLSPEYYTSSAYDETDLQVILKRILLVRKEILEECLELRELLKKFSENSIP